MDAQDRIADFDNPPLVEVVIGARFKCPGFTAAHLGLFWAGVREEFPHVEAAPPLVSLPLGGVAEQLARAQAGTGTGEDVLPIRVFLVKPDETQLIQLQTDRFHVNWRRRQPATSYPKYDQLREAFFVQWKRFVGFAEHENLGSLAVQHYEMSYVNHVPANAPDNPLSVSDVFPWLQVGSIVDLPPDLNLAVRADVPECRGEVNLRLTSGIRQHDEQRVLVLELTVRGRPLDPEDHSDFPAWCDHARERIVKTFLAATDAQVRANIWRQT